MGIDDIKTCPFLKAGLFIQPNGLTRACSQWGRPMRGLNSNFSIDNHITMVGNIDVGQSCVSCIIAEQNDGINSMRKLIDDRLWPKVTVSMSNTCNAACVICSETSSTRILEEKRRGNIMLEYPLDELRSYVDLAPRKKDLVIEAIRHYRAEYDRPVVLEVLGGDVSVDTHAMSLLNDLMESGASSEIMLTLSTNGQRYINDIARYAREFKSVYLSMSMDGIGAEFEYLRYGCKWMDFCANLSRYQSLSASSNLKVGIAYAQSWINARHFFDVLEWYDALDNQPTIYMSRIHFPEVMSADCLPDQVRKNLLKMASGVSPVTDSAKVFLRRYIESLTNIRHHGIGWGDGIARLGELDALRGNTHLLLTEPLVRMANPTTS